MWLLTKNYFQYKMKTAQIYFKTMRNHRAIHEAYNHAKTVEPSNTRNKKVSLWITILVIAGLIILFSIFLYKPIQNFLGAAPCPLPVKERIILYAGVDLSNVSNVEYRSVITRVTIDVHDQSDRIDRAPYRADFEHMHIEKRKERIS